MKYSAEKGLMMAAGGTKLVNGPCEHDVCISCKTKRKYLKESPWGRRDGFICIKCQDIEWKKAIDAFTQEDFEKSDFECRSDIKCPYCGHKYDPDDLHEDTETDCPNCNSTMNVKVAFVADYSISKIED